MCASVRYKDRRYNSPVDLAELVGGAGSIIWRTENPFRGAWPASRNWRVMDLCLCPVDLEKTLMKAGLEWTRANNPFEWLVISRNA